MVINENVSVRLTELSAGKLCSFIPCNEYKKARGLVGFFWGGVGSGHALTIFSMGNLASHICRPIQQYNI